MKLFIIFKNYKKYFREFSIKISNDETYSFNLCENLNTKCRIDPGLAMNMKGDNCINIANGTYFEKVWKLCKIFNTF